MTNPANPVVPPVVPPVTTPAAPSKLATAKDAIGRGFTSFTSAVSNFEANLGKGINLELSQQFVGPLATGEERAQLTTMQKAGNIIKTVFNGIDNAGAAVSRGIFATTEQLFGRPHVIANEDAVSFINNQMINGRGEVVLPAGALLTAINTNSNAFTLNAQGHILNAQGQRVNLAGEVAEDKKIFNLAGRVTNVVAHVAAVAVRAVAIALAAIASVVCSVLGIVIGTPVAAVVGAVKGIQNKMQASADAKAAATQDRELRQMRAFAIGVNTSTAATASREAVMNSIAFVNNLAPVRFNADGTVATDLHIDEQAAAQARILLANRLAQLDAEYAASMRGRTSAAISSAASTVGGKVSSVVSPVINGVKTVASKAAGIASTVASPVISGVRTVASKTAGAASTVATFAGNHKKAIAAGTATVATVGGGAAYYMAREAAKVAAAQAQTTFLGQVAAGVVGVGALAIGAYRYFRGGADAPEIADGFPLNLRQNANLDAPVNVEGHDAPLLVFDQEVNNGAPFVNNGAPVIGGQQNEEIEYL